MGCASSTQHALAGQVGADDPADATVHQQVRVAANRRGEMGIGRVVQAEVALVLGLVDRLCERAQQHGLDDVGIGAILDLLPQVLVVQRRGVVTAAHIQAQLAEETAQVFELLLAGPSCTRYRMGSLSSKKRAVATLAHSMHSSISLWASLRSTGTMDSILRWASKMMRVSTVSKSMAPRLVAGLAQHLVQAVQATAGAARWPCRHPGDCRARSPRPPGCR